MLVLISSLVPVAFCTALMAIIVSYDIFRPIKVDVGYGHYAEKPDSAIGPYKFPEWARLEMPLNTLVNAGYVAMGLYWILRTYLAERKGKVGLLHAYFAYTFGWMGILYGLIQYLRIVDQTHQSAVLDQWATLPFFTWLIMWSRSLTAGWDPKVSLIFMASSLLSFNLVFFTEFGFEILLILHAVNAVNACLTIQTKHPCDGNIRTIILVVVSFTIFVVFKLADLHLPQYGDIFTVVSGHFLSKLVGDLGQIHFVFVFFENIAMKLQSEECAKKSHVNNSKKKK